MSQLDDISGQVTVLSDIVVEYKNHPFKLTKSGKKDRNSEKLIDIYCCICKQTHGCRMTIRKETSTSFFFISKIHRNWEHNHLSLIEIEQKRAREKEIEEREKLFEMLLARKLRMESLTISEERIYHSFLSRLSGDFEEVSEDVISLICCFLLEEDIDSLRKTSQYFKIILNRDSFFFAYSKSVYDVDLQEYQLSYRRNNFLSQSNLSKKKKGNKPKMISPKRALKMFEVNSLNEVMGKLLQKKISRFSIRELYDSTVPKIMSKRRDFAIRIVGKLDGTFLSCLHPEFQKDETIVTEAVSNFPASMQYAHHSLKGNRKFILHLMQQVSTPESLRYCVDEIRNDMEIGITVCCMESFERERHRDVIGEKLWENPEFFANLCLFDPMKFFQMAPLQLQKDKQVVLAVLQTWKTFYSCHRMDAELKEDEDIIRAYNQPKRRRKVWSSEEQKMV